MYVQARTDSCVQARRYTFGCTHSRVQVCRYRFECTDSCVQVRTYRFVCTGSCVQIRPCIFVGTDSCVCTGSLVQVCMYRLVCTAPGAPKSAPERPGAPTIFARFPWLYQSTIRKDCYVLRSARPWPSEEHKRTGPQVQICMYRLVCTGSYVQFWM